jgi:streptomycin 6-kinase
MVVNSHHVTVEARLASHANQWRVSVAEVRSTETSLLGFGTRGSQPVVLKVIRKENSEEWYCGDVLEMFRGEGVIRPLDYTAGAVLLPRLQPGHDLASLYSADRDDETSEIIASLIARLPVVPNPSGIASVDRLRADFSRFRGGAEGFMPQHFVDRADALFGELCLTQSSARLLHGDLHHFNVLFDQRDGWMVIDPWGPKGELEFEIGPSLRNPVPHVPDDPRRLERRMRIYENRLKLDATRTLKWAFTTTVLGVLWPFDTSFGQDLRLPFAQAARAMWQLMGEDGRYG